MHLYAGARGEKQHQRVAAPVRDQESAAGSEQGEHEAFRQQLPPQARATCADGEPHTHFMAPRERANQQ
jgi:hypothetical protein